MITEQIQERITKSIKYVKPVPCETAAGLVAVLYEQMQADFLVLSLTRHLPNPEGNELSAVKEILSQDDETTLVRTFSIHS